MGGYEQVIGSLPVRNVQPPPEGTMAAGLTFTLTSVTERYRIAAIELAGRNTTIASRHAID